MIIACRITFSSKVGHPSKLARGDQVTEISTPLFAKGLFHGHLRPILWCRNDSSNLLFSFWSIIILSATAVYLLFLQFLACFLVDSHVRVTDLSSPMMVISRTFKISHVMRQDGILSMEDFTICTKS